MMLMPTCYLTLFFMAESLDCVFDSLGSAAILFGIDFFCSCFCVDSLFISIEF